MSTNKKIPKIDKTKSATTDIVTLRLDKDTALYYRKRANERGTTLSEFLRNMVVQGMVAENMLDAEERLQALVASIGQSHHSGGSANLPEDVLRSIYTTEFLLTAIVEARDIQQLYEVQKRVQLKLTHLTSP